MPRPYISQQEPPWRQFCAIGTTAKLVLAWQEESGLVSKQVCILILHFKVCVGVDEKKEQVSVPGASSSTSHLALLGQPLVSWLRENQNTVVSNLATAAYRTPGAFARQA